ncbi:hypothetical protein GCM10010429_18390 [Micromonospora olivasterospora]
MPARRTPRAGGPARPGDLPRSPAPGREPAGFRLPPYRRRFPRFRYLIDPLRHNMV